MQKFAYNAIFAHSMFLLKTKATDDRFLIAVAAYLNTPEAQHFPHAAERLTPYFRLLEKRLAKLSLRDRRDVSDRMRTAEWLMTRRGIGLVWQRLFGFPLAETELRSGDGRT
jgi:hypothetical protein